MPVSDNLYSANDSDGESFSEELSPSDGYFRRGEMAPSALVQDPQIEDDKKPEPKMLIPVPNARGTPRPSTAANHPALSQIQASRSHAPPQEHGVATSPAFPPQMGIVSSRESRREALDQAAINGPPPAYTPNPTTSSSRYLPDDAPSAHTPETQSPRRYSTFSEQPQLERGFFQPLREPESMGGVAEGDADEETPLTGEESRKPRRVRALKHVIIFGVLIAVLVGWFIISFHARTNVSHS